MASFHEVRFPLDIALGARGGPERRTEIVTLGSGREVRNARWADARRRWDAGWGVRSFAALTTIVAFFEERRGRLHGFRWRDRLDHSSALPGGAVGALDQVIGTGDGTRTEFELVKTYGGGSDPYARRITKPVTGTVTAAVGGSTRAVVVDATKGLIRFATPPAAGARITAGFEFDVPVRFDTDFLEIDHAAFDGGAIPSIPIIEIRA
jgi:uncharacterized protein (TIGR02217 family)